MGAKKDKDKKILKRKEDEAIRLIGEYQDHNVSARKISKMQAKKDKYTAWRAEVDSKPDY